MRPLVTSDTFPDHQGPITGLCIKAINIIYICSDASRYHSFVLCKKFGCRGRVGGQGEGVMGSCSTFYLDAS